MMENTDLAWAAGFFDGEGSIFIVRQRRNGLPSNHVLRIEAAQKVKFPLIKFMEMFGGKIYDGKDGCYHWRTSAKSAGLALEQLLPYLVVKKDQAEVALEFQARRNGPGRIAKALQSLKLEQDEQDRILIKNLKIVVA